MKWTVSYNSTYALHSTKILSTFQIHDYSKIWLIIMHTMLIGLLCLLKMLEIKLVYI